MRSNIFQSDFGHINGWVDPPSSAHGSETWVWTKGEENQLLVFERKVLQTICGPKIKNGVYRRRCYHELDKEFDSSNALNVTKTSRLRYAGHMIRRPENLPQNALFRAKPNRRRNQGRPKSSWADGVNSDSLADMERSSSTGLNQVLVAVPHKYASK
jgi:hypothetical protein